MSTAQTTTLQESLTKISKKSGKTLAEVQEAFNNALTTLPPSYSEAQKQKYALKIVHKDLLINTKSTAIAYEGIIVGTGRTRDLMKGIRTRAITSYNENPEAAINEGLVKLEGENVIVLDNRKELSPGKPNPKFGQERPKEMLMRECIIAARIPGESKWIPGKISLWNNAAKLSTPVGVLLGFKANGELDNNEYSLRSSVETSFEPKPTNLNPNEIMRIIDTTFEGHYKALGECFEYCKSIQGTPARWDHYVVTEGTIQYINLNDDPTKNHRIVISDDTLGDDTQSVTVWLPNALRHLVDFGRGTIVTIIAQTSINKGYDSKTKQQTDEDVLALNAFSIFGRPGLKTSPQEDGELI